MFIFVLMIAVEKYKGIHPGFVLKRELEKRNLKQRPFALSLNEHPQTLNAITKGKRHLNTALALKIEKALGMKEGTLVLLQAYHDIQLEKAKLNTKTPDLSKIRKILFWDTDFEKLDWNQQYKAIIRRVFNRGNETEKKVIKDFYGLEKINKALVSENRKPYSVTTEQ